MEAESKKATFEPKDFALFVPMVATVMATIFDVGYFLAADFNFFTLFTLAEHVVFALQALPFAILFVLSGYLGFGRARAGRHGVVAKGTAVDYERIFFIAFYLASAAVALLQQNFIHWLGRHSATASG
jgi:hypothetical protein